MGPAAAGFAAKVWRILRARAAPVSRATSAAAPSTDFRDRMASALAAFKGRSLVLLSGRDLVAAEFRDYLRQTPALLAWSRDPRTSMIDFPQADHTFSSREHKRAAEDATVAWLASIEEAFR